MFKRELTAQQRARMDMAFWNAYQEIMELTGKIRAGRTNRYNRICSVVDYFPKGPEGPMEMVRIKALRVQNELSWPEIDLPLLRESLADLINYAAYAYGMAVAERQK